MSVRSNVNMPAPVPTLVISLRQSEPVKRCFIRERDRAHVAWQIARDDAMKDVARSGTAKALPALAHSVHVEVTGLEPDRPYWYRFRAAGAESPVGRTRTTPAPGAAPQTFRFAFASCQNYT